MEKQTERKGNSLIPHIFSKPRGGLGTVVGARRAAVRETYIPVAKEPGKANDSERCDRSTAVLGRQTLSGEPGHWGFGET